MLTFDQRGSGLSDKPDMPYTIAMIADDTASLMDHVGFAAAHIIGVSMGGMIAQEFALRHPKKTRSLVLGCTTPGWLKSIRAVGSATGARLNVLEPAGHCFWLEQPEQSHNAIARFLADCDQ